MSVLTETGTPAASKARSVLELSLLWLTVLVPLVAPLVAVALLWGRWVSGRDLALLAGMYLACGLGITIGYHRMMTHRSFRPHPVVKFLLLALGTMAAMGPAMYWAATHLQHHSHTDDEGDPHSPWDWVDKVRNVRKTGFWRFQWAHFLWIIYGDQVPLTKYGQELQKDPMIRWMSRWPVVVGWILLGFAIPYIVGGWQGLLWGGVIRVGLTHHITWSINSVCHVFGRRMFQTPDCSRNNWLFGLLGLGEGWHNNHHAFPRSAFHGLRWWQVDVSGYIIRGMERLGWVEDVWRIPKPTLAARLKEARRSRSAAQAE